ncbi:MAG TPA: hypothetical protein VK541_06700 [Pedobacter sp.]|uniref:hypothetical protein n=1 Tax=Pedobacter sp. TaxID=1411316 RepID=UPI002BCB32EF|nr:hypothetical protein [Pedobacter sp.]HMI02151.1 hypothetical protein [Pedobacter sp.]
MKHLLSVLILSALFGCSAKTSKQLADPLEIIKQREKTSGEKDYAYLGKFLGTISFEVKTTDTASFEDGLIPWASLEKPEQDIPELKDAEETLISRKTAIVLIDYPLRNEYKFELNSETGFTREFLLKEISKTYYKIYAEEEATATVKTIPIEKRTKMYNRNETNGKYGIWGHDIADLVLAEIQVYETSDKKLVLVLVINS